MPTPLPENPLEGLEWTEEALQRGDVPERRQAPLRRASDQQQQQQQWNARQAYEQAQEEGFQAGYRDGIEKGIQEGLTQGMEKGIANGYDTGYHKGMEEAQHAAQAIWAIIQQLDIAKTTVLEQAMQDLVPMAMAIAQRLIKTEVSCDRNLVASIALDVLRNVDRSQKEVVFKVHPDDVSRLRQHIQDHEELWLGEVRRTLIVSPDGSVDPGSCMVETAGGQIDARFKTQLNVIRGLLGLPELSEQALAPENEFDYLLQDEHSTNSLP
jgi:flagellar assembly protein FliH